MTYMGFIIDSITMTVYPTSEKIEKIVQTCQGLLECPHPTIREVAFIPRLLQTGELESDPSRVDRLLDTAQIAERLYFVLRSTYFQCNESIYEQQEGAVMGIPVSTIIANLCMESLEKTGNSYFTVQT